MYEHSKGHKELIIIVSLVMGYASIQFATMIYGTTSEAMTPILVRFIVTICVAYFLFIGKAWAKTLFNLYLVLMVVTSLLVILPSVNYGWQLESTIAVLALVLHTYSIYQMMRSKDIAAYLKYKSGEVG